jgi:hypothetical protein
VMLSSRVLMASGAWVLVRSTMSATGDKTIPS